LLRGPDGQVSDTVSNLGPPYLRDA
jgi:hypothetical protein